jgi:hypothetical protein
MNLVHYDARDAGKEAARTLRGQQDEQRFRGGHEHVGRFAQHLLTLGGRRVAGSYRRSNRRERNASFSSELDELGQRFFEVLVHVVGERLKRRDIDDQRLIRQRPGCGAADEIV